MQMEMTFGMVFITAALLSYTIAVWGEQITKDLKPGFVVLFCVGVFCDTTGTLLMTLIETSPLGFYETLFHIYYRDVCNITHAHSCNMGNQGISAER